MIPPEPDRLIGRWSLLRADSALDFAPGVCMDFRAGGRLFYRFEVGGARHELALYYRVDSDVLHTESPTTTHEVSTHFAFGPGDVLVLDFSGAKAWFVRQI